MKYLAVIEKAGKNYSAYLPDVPGCIATGKTMKEVRDVLSRALVMHLKGLIEDGIQVPDPIAVADYITFKKEKAS